MQINGWAVINESYVWDDNLNDQRQAIVQRIAERIGEPAFNEMVEWRWLNGSAVVHVALQHNHYNASADALIDFFRDIGEVAPGSYGQLHVHDDEGQFAPSGTVTVFVLARGELVRYTDPFFTPYVPNVEGPDPDDPEPAPVAARLPKYLPIGSVVHLQGGDKKLMIFGRLQQDSANGKVFDYVGCPYPEGHIAPKATFLFNHADIAWIHYLGLADADEAAWTDKLKALPGGA
jgi:hypothetical protein